MSDVSDLIRGGQDLSSPVYLFSLRSKSLNYMNLPFFASSSGEAISRIRSSLDVGQAWRLDDLELVLVGSFISQSSRDPKSGSYKKLGLVPAKQISVIVDDLSKLLNSSVWIRKSDSSNSTISEEVPNA